MMGVRAASARRGERGFTLLELIVVLVIVALAAALAYPYVNRSRAAYQLQAAALDIATQLRDVRTAAQSRNVDQALVIDVANRRVWMEGAEARRPLSRHVAFEIEVPASEQLASSTVRFRFFPDGTASGGRVVLREGGRQSTVTVNWLNGDVRTE